MAEYFRRLATHAAYNRLAVIDPADTTSFPPRRYTYAQLLDRVTTFREHVIGAAKKAQLQLEGARIGVMVPPGVDFVAAVLSIWSLRAIVVPICLSHPLQEIAYTVTDSDQAIVFYHTTFRPRLATLLKDRVGLDVNSISKDAVPNEAIDYAALHWPADTSSTIIYTSGTTGSPKGVVHTAGSSEHPFRGLAQVWQISSQDRALHVLPLHHGHGFNLSLFLPLWAGATVEFMSKFDERRAWQRLLDSGKPSITILMAVPTIWVKMIDYFDQNIKNNIKLARKAKNAASSLRLAISGSAALPGTIRQAWADIANGYLLLERYGTTEVGIIYSGTLESNGRIQGSVGWPVPGLQTRLVADDGRDVSIVPGIVGEIQVKTPGLLKEYWRRPGAASKEITSDGWWKTGDMAVVKAECNNAAFIQGRASVDIIKSGGYKISALDIEAAMLQLPFVREVAVMGVPDPTWGEMVAAVCVPVEGKAEELTVANVRERLRIELAPYKLPQKLHVLKTMPRNAMGKVQKKALREKCFPNSPTAKL